MVAKLNNKTQTAKHPANNRQKRRGQETRQDIDFVREAGIIPGTKGDKRGETQLPKRSALLPPGGGVAAKGFLTLQLAILK
ncbi:MAG: hypothetical protein J1E63_07415 [Muribaculaceae bacterium]|nr:hypothetical protein [Muribaculaceae bacterium]